MCFAFIINSGLTSSTRFPIPLLFSHHQTPEVFTRGFFEDACLAGLYFPWCQCPWMSPALSSLLGQALLSPVSFPVSLAQSAHPAPPPKPDCTAVSIFLAPALCSLWSFSRSHSLKIPPSNPKMFVRITNNTVLVPEPQRQALGLEFVQKWLTKEGLPRETTRSGVGSRAGSNRKPSRGLISDK